MIGYLDRRAALDRHADVARRWLLGSYSAETPIVAQSVAVVGPDSAFVSLNLWGDLVLVRTDGDGASMVEWDKDRGLAIDWMVESISCVVGIESTEGQVGFVGALRVGPDGEAVVHVPDGWSFRSVEFADGHVEPTVTMRTPVSERWLTAQYRPPNNLSVGSRVGFYVSDAIAENEAAAWRIIKTALLDTAPEDVEMIAGGHLWELLRTASTELLSQIDSDAQSSQQLLDAVTMARHY